VARLTTLLVSSLFTNTVVMHLYVSKYSIGCLQIRFALAIVIAVSMTISSINIIKTMKTEAANKDLDIARYIDKPYLGLMGVIMSLPKDEATLNELAEQLNSLSKTGND
jgi:hypothetical protein